MVVLDDDFMADMKATYDRYAKNGGSIDAKKFPEVLRAVGLNPTQAQAAEWKRECGSNIGWDNFKKLAMTKFNESHDCMDEVESCFSVFDKDGNGMISVAEFRHILCNMGEPLTAEEFEEVLKDADVSNGTIDYRIFAQMVYPESN